tara:strand:+ start:1955 stop:2653 length:699 start_codon:yes stop_codon:yes gene_type:complete
MAKTLSVCLFTASRKRPLLLRHCLYQMQAQTYPHTHSIYLNTDTFNDDQDSDNLLGVMSDISINSGCEVQLAYGPSAHQHHNHMEALNLINIEDFDLFLKIDDDDLYKPRYIETVVDDYLKNQWDISGSFSDGLLNHHRYEKNKVYQIDYTLQDKSLFSILPGTLAFSKKAITYITKDFLPFLDLKLFEDEQWIDFLSSKDDINFHMRSSSLYIYNIHDNNISKPKKSVFKR